MDAPFRPPVFMSALRSELHRIYIDGLSFTLSRKDVPALSRVGEDYQMEGHREDVSNMVDYLLRTAFDSLPQTASRNVGAGLTELFGLGAKPWRGIEDRRENAARAFGYKNGEALRKSRINGRSATEHFIDLAVERLVDMTSEVSADALGAEELFMVHEHTFACCMNSWYDELHVVVRHGLPLSEEVTALLPNLMLLGSVHLSRERRESAENLGVSAGIVESLISEALIEHGPSNWQSVMALNALLGRDEGPALWDRRWAAFEVVERYAQSLPEARDVAVGEGSDGFRDDAATYQMFWTIAMLVNKLTDWLSDIAKRRGYIHGGMQPPREFSTSALACFRPPGEIPF